MLSIQLSEIWICSGVAELSTRPLFLWNHSPTPGTWGFSWLPCPSMLSPGLPNKKNSLDAEGWGIYNQLACVTREGRGCCLLLFVCLRDKASFDTDSSQLICSLNCKTRWRVCTVLQQQCSYVCVHEFMPLFARVRVCVCRAKGQWVLAVGSYGDVDWKMQLGGDSQTAGGQRSTSFLCSHLADCFFLICYSGSLSVCIFLLLLF